MASFIILFYEEKPSYPHRCDPLAKISEKVYCLPFRSIIVKELVDAFNLNQTDASVKLRKTHVAVSLYVNSKRAIGGLEQFADTLLIFCSENCWAVADNEIGS